MRVPARLASLFRRRPAAQADPLAASRLPFLALLREPRLLHRLPRAQARGIADVATRHAGALLRGEDAADRSQGGRDGARQVLRAARQFLACDELCGPPVEAMIAAASDPLAGGLGRLLATLADATPEFGEEAGALAVVALRALSDAGLARLARRDAGLLTLAATRHAASFLRGERAMPHAEAGGDRDAILGALALVDRFHAARGSLPLDAPFAGAGIAQAEASAGLWRDAATVLAHLAPTAHALAWAHARDGHAFAALHAEPAILDLLAAADADGLAADATRAARLVLADRTAPPRVHEAARQVRAASGSTVPVPLPVPARRVPAGD